MSDSLSADQRVCSAMRQLASARSGSEQIAVNRAESLVIALLLPHAFEVGADRPALGPSSDRARIIAARLTRAVLDWDPGSEPPERAATALIARLLPPAVTHVPDPDVPAVEVTALPTPRSVSSAVVPRRVPRAG